MTISTLRLHAAREIGTVFDEPRGTCLPVTPLTTTAPAGDSGSEQLEFPDNRLLSSLCGEVGRNLAQIEAASDVQIVQRGNRLDLFGGLEDRRRAAEVLIDLYERLEAGREIEPGDIDAALRLGPRPVPPEMRAGMTSGDQLEMFKPGAVEIKTRKKLVEPRTAAQKAYVDALFRHELAFGIGPAGTGKTYLAVAVAVSKFIGGEVDRIILSRPAVEAGERLGCLSGDMKDKFDPYMQPLYDALNDFLPGKQVTKLIEEKRIEIAPLSFMRVLTLSNAFVVLDEAQNATTMQMKMFLTRLGEGSRMVITGDRSQVDLPRGVQSGLRDAERLLGNIDKVSFSYFTAKDVVRHPLVAAIIEAYDADAPAG